MKADDILKQLGFSDEELKSFFNKQKKYSEKVGKIKDYKDSFGITMHTPAYTPRTLVNRLSSMYVPEGRTSTDTELLKAGHKVSKLARDFDLFGKIEREQEIELQSYEEGIPTELKETVKEFLNAVNKFTEVDTSEETVDNIISKYKDNPQELLNELNDIIDTLYMYTGAKSYTDNETGEVMYYQPNLSIAIQKALSLIYS